MTVTRFFILMLGFSLSLAACTPMQKTADVWDNGWPNTTPAFAGIES